MLACSIYSLHKHLNIDDELLNSLNCDPSNIIFNIINTTTLKKKNIIKPSKYWKVGQN